VQTTQQRPAPITTDQDFNSLTHAELLKVNRLADQMMLHASPADLEKVNKIAHDLSPEQRQDIAQTSMTPVQYLYRVQALKEFRKQRARKASKAIDANSGNRVVNNTMPQDSQPGLQLHQCGECKRSWNNRDDLHQHACDAPIYQMRQELMEMLHRSETEYEELRTRFYTAFPDGYKHPATLAREEFHYYQTLHQVRDAFTKDDLSSAPGAVERLRQMVFKVNTLCELPKEKFREALGEHAATVDPGAG
jgi:hypothetical protein